MRKQFDNWTVDSMDMNGKKLISLMRKMTYPLHRQKVLTLLLKKMLLWQN